MIRSFRILYFIYKIADALACETGTSSGKLARKRKTGGEIFWNPPTTPPTRSATGREEAKPSPNCNISITFEEKPHSSSKAIAGDFNRQFTASTVPEAHTLRRLMTEILQHYLVDPKGVANAAAIW